MIEFVDSSTVTLYRAEASDMDVARAAWVSQDAAAHEKEKEAGRVEGLINFLWRNRHTSPFEHGQFTFIVECPLFVAREFHRHRTASYNEISGRYTVLPYKYYLLPDNRPVIQKGKVGAYTFEQDAELLEQNNVILKETAEFCNKQYERSLALGTAKEVARMNLHVSQVTTFWATMNPRNLMHFLDLRTAPDALFEIREVANKMEDYFHEEMPLTWKAWSANT